jgi:carbonic anhydrase
MPRLALLTAGILLGYLAPLPAHASEHEAPAAAKPAVAAPAAAAPPATGAKRTPMEDVAERLRIALEKSRAANGVTVKAEGVPAKPAEPARVEKAAKAPPAHAAHVAKAATSHEHVALAAYAPPDPAASRNYLRARAAAIAGHETSASLETPAAGGHGAKGEAHWSYEGESGPQSWAGMKPEFGTCSAGKRQSPIHIRDSATLQGPAEPLQINYSASTGTVINNGHTIQVDVQGGQNTLTVRGSVYRLVQFHFHHPAEEVINDRGFAMVAHLVHRNAEGQLAVLAILLDPGVANSLVQNVWTYMPLDVADKVPMPGELIDLNALLPQDQRYYQFIGSLTTPPCTEGVLWMVLKQPSSISRAQLKMFAQLFPNNARPVQALNGRPVRDAQ